MKVKLKSGKIESLSGNDFRNRFNCSFLGWECHSPLYSLNITADGDLTAGICRSQWYGNIFENNFSEIERTPIICPKKFCTAIPDISCEKKAPQTSSSLIEEVKKESSNLNLNWDLSRMCNFDCHYCSPEFHRKGARFHSIEQYQKGWTNTLNFLGNTGPLSKIQLSILGGEPTQFEQLPELIEFLHGSGRLSGLYLLTNGSRPLEYLKKLTAKSQLVFSIHFEFIKIESMINKIIKLDSYSKKVGHTPPLIKIMTVPGFANRSLLFKQQLSNHLDENQIELLILRDPNSPFPQFYDYSKEELELLKRN